MSVLFALLILIVIAAVAFWLMDKLKTAGTGLPPIAFTIGYVIIVVFALFALYAIATGPLALPSLK